MGKFQKGSSGNPTTQFKQGNAMQKSRGYEQIKTVVKRILSTQSVNDTSLTNSEAIVFAMVNKALLGDIHAANSLFDRVHGKPKAEIEISGQAAYNLRYSNLDEMKAKLAALEGEIGECE